MARVLITVALLTLGVLTLSAGVRSAHADHPITPAAAHGSTLPEAVALAMISAMNAERSAADLPPLTLTTDVQDVAIARAAALSATGLLSHSDPAGHDVVTLLEQAGISFNRFGENLGLSDVSVTDVAATLHAAWMESPDHRANILDLEFRRIGMSLVDDGRAIYAAVVFLD